jgi:glyoxylase I family protein
MKFTVEHLGLAARDSVSLKDWYVRVLGAEVVFDSGRKPPAFLLNLPGGLTLEIYSAEAMLAETGNNLLAGWRHLALQVESIESAKAALESGRVNFTELVKPAVGGGRVLFFRDAEGNLLHLVERNADSAIKPRP